MSPCKASGPKRAVSAKLLGMAFALLALCPLATAEPLPEYSVKAAFLYNFLKFVEWPAPGGEAFSICLLGGDPFGDALAAIESKQAQGRAVRVLRNVGMEQAKACHILFISAEEASRLVDLLRRLEGAPTLTVGDMQGFAEAGGMVGFVTADHRVQLEINLQAVEQAKLKMSSQLLKLAHVK